MPAIGVGFRGPDGNPGYLLRQAHQTFRSAMEAALREIGVTSSQYSILSVIEVESGCSGAELARDAVMTEQSASELVVGLEKAGLIQRSRGSADRRIRHIDLTAAGRAALDLATPRVRALESQMLEGLAEAERDQLCTWLARAAVRLSHPRVDVA